MKKLVIVAIAVLLAMPVLSYAGSATSKWDMTIGGFVNVHFAWSDVGVGSGFKTIPRNNGTREVEQQGTGNFSSEAQGRLNFIVKGPDAWGAKTIGRLEFDFLGAAATGPQGAGAYTAGAANSQNYGEAYLRHAYLQFDWAMDSLLIGNTWYTYNGATAPGGGLTFQSLPNIIIPSRTPQVRWTHKFTKEFQTNAALEYPGLMRWLNRDNNFGDRYTQSGYPNAVLNLTYASELCGRIGPETLKFGVSGVYGRESYLRSTATVARGAVYSNKQNDGWIVASYAFIPIIPEKNMDKAGALGIQGGYIVGQGLSNYSGGAWISTYARTPGMGFTEDFSTPRGYGYYAALTAYAHDKVHFDFLFTDTFAKGSNRWAGTVAGQTTVARSTLWNLALMYEPNPAIMMGAEYSRIMAKYAQYGNAPAFAASSRTGVMNGVRLFAQYSF